METEKNVLIITDGAEETVKMASEIATVLEGNKVLSKNISEFRGNDILPADAFFLGCKNPDSRSFAYIEDLFKHINLSGRSCGVFSCGSEETTKYLAGLIGDCGAALNPEFYKGSDKLVENWAKSVVLRSF